MTPSLKISQKIISRLPSADFDQHSGRLFGILARNTLYILGLQLDSVSEPLTDLVHCFPAEIDVCGVITLGDDSYDEPQVITNLSKIEITDNPIFLNYNKGSGHITASFYRNDRLERTQYTAITEEEFLSQFLHARLQGTLSLSCEISHEAIKEALLNLRKTVASGVMAFNFVKTNIYLLGGDGENGVVGLVGNPGVGELFGDENDLSEGSGRKRKAPKSGNDLVIINVAMLKRNTREEVVPQRNHAPICVLDKKQCKTVTLSVPIDALALLHRQTKVVSLYEIIVESAIRNLRLLENTFLAALNRIEGKISQPDIYHFYSEEYGHFITKIYLKNDSESILLPERKHLHHQFLLPLNRPLFRRTNSYTFKTGNGPVMPLINPHEGLKNTDNGGKIALVKGKYSYYHYGQNKMDDNGWGCAYRSLQTLASWFKLQGFTDKDVPTFTDIQKCLVDIGDKPSSFIDSKQWIGSTEVNFVLNTLLGVTNKILYVSSGEEMGTKGPELLSHFENHGSPVMIGGGVLAHTILGVDYNLQTGTLKFLILDPHYTGGEDLHTIQSKGWCGWKGVEFWDKASYYNMCLPQVPVEV